MAGRRGLCVLLLLSALLAAAAPTGETARGPRAVGRAGSPGGSSIGQHGVRWLPAFYITGCGAVRDRLAAGLRLYQKKNRKQDSDL